MSIASGVASAHPSLLKRQGRSLAFWLTAVVALAAVATLVLWPSPGYGQGDPENPRRVGTQAVAKVLQRQGVDVSVVRSSADLQRQHPAGPATLVVSSRKTSMTPYTASSIDKVRSRYQRVVLIAPHTELLHQVGLGSLRSTTSGVSSVHAGCTDQAIGGASTLGRVGDGSLRYFATGGDLDTPPPGCFTVSGQRPGTMLVRAPGPQEVFAVADREIFTNEQVMVADNAALALTLLGNNRQLVWFSTTTEDEPDTSPTDKPGLSAVLPPWWDAVQRLLTATIVIALIWQVRRFGPLVTERMPVVIKAIETTVNRGHLYHRAGAKDRAVASLQRATRRRLRLALALPRDCSDDELIRAVAQATGRDPHQVHQVLTDSTPVTNDETMVLRAQTLAQLEEEVRRA